MLSRNTIRLARRISSNRVHFQSPNPFIGIKRSTPIKSLRPPQSAHLFTTSLRNASAPMAAPTDTQAEEIQSTTGITPDTLTETLKSSSSLNPVHVDIQDISGGCGASFAAVIVSDVFQGKSALQRHRLVNGLLKEEIKAIHAWTPRCLTSEQWEKEKARTG